ncbi:MAG: hypothetical protein M0P66_06695, partial [Salinivirgaceae bacterium]|nr:hypothetical protein [Salinivirgaceae bacterium]
QGVLGSSPRGGAQKNLRRFFAEAFCFHFNGRDYACCHVLLLRQAIGYIFVGTFIFIFCQNGSF